MSDLRDNLALTPAVFLAWVALALWPTSGDAQTNDVPRYLRERAECMYQALRTIPGVSEPKLGYVTSDGWTHPYLEYLAAEDSASVRHPRFEAEKSDNGNYRFLAVLSGLGGPNIHISAAVMQKWKTQCSVEANILFP